MATPTRYVYRIKHGPGVVAHVQVNDLPFYRGVSMHHAAPSGPFTHLLVEGENTVVIRLAETEHVPFRVRDFELLVLREEDEKVIFARRWPMLADEHPEGERELPIVHRARFVFDEPMPRALWADAPVESFPATGTAEQHTALRALHEAYARGDVDGFLQVMEHKTADFRKFYGPVADLEPAAARAYYGEKLAQPWKLAPYDPERVVFERCADGRAAYATDPDGGPALVARHELEPGETWQANPLLSRVDGRWRVIW